MNISWLETNELHQSNIDVLGHIASQSSGENSARIALKGLLAWEQALRETGNFFRTGTYLSGMMRVFNALPINHLFANHYRRKVHDGIS
ncbi:hypothetical protein [Cellvibrio sp. PSBB023]|uniref:hypothetical protein n=1 Tax=Cellvibrio sp. PSBB023 TaxID=1945512 RepID=UPI00098EC448|nr:hypothetical protein [Cellvibrio sp. PSBB023]AQT61887.1 hypothetical protein B0D95_18590 [Cellvibrio sp. PSBB023]